MSPRVRRAALTASAAVLAVLVLSFSLRREEQACPGCGQARAVRSARLLWSLEVWRREEGPPAEVPGHEHRWFWNSVTERRLPALLWEGAP